MDRFIDGLEVSKELKAWMKKQHTVELSGEDFMHRVKADAILGVPEFYDAYLRHNKGYSFMGFPSPKYREADKEKNPEKYEKLKQEYHDALHKFIEANPQSVEGFEVYLNPLNPRSVGSVARRASAPAARTHDPARATPLPRRQSGYRPERPRRVHGDRAR